MVGDFQSRQIDEKALKSALKHCIPTHAQTDQATGSAFVKIEDFRVCAKSHPIPHFGKDPKLSSKHATSTAQNRQFWRF